MDHAEILKRIENRYQGQCEWLLEDAPYTLSDQKHLDANTPERAYWHHGYTAALADVLALFGVSLSQKGSSGDTSS